MAKGPVFTLNDDMSSIACLPCSPQAGLVLLNPAAAQGTGAPVAGGRCSNVPCAAAAGCQQLASPPCAGAAPCPDPAQATHALFQIMASFGEDLCLFGYAATAHRVRGEGRLQQAWHGAGRAQQRPASAPRFAGPWTAGP